MAHFDIAIIGTGSGNSILDERYAGKRVAICEQGVFGGTCLNVGCIPTKMFVYAAEVAQSARESAQYGVDAHVDEVRWSDIVSRVFGRIDPLAMGGENYRRSSPNVQVFASHARFRAAPARRPLHAAHRRRRRIDRRPGRHRSRARDPSSPTRSPHSGVRYHTSDTIMRIADVPEHLVIVGGGFVACEFAHVFSALGSRVTMMIRGSTLLRGHDDDICRCASPTSPARSGRLSSHHEVAGLRRGRRRRRAALPRRLDGARRRAAGRHRQDTQRRPARRRSRRASKVTAQRPGRRRRVPAHDRARAFSRSVTCRRTISSSTSPTTRPAS